MKHTRWACEVVPSRDGWSNLRIVLWLDQPHRGKQFLKFLLGVRRERFARVNELRRICDTAPEAAQEIVDWWESMQAEVPAGVIGT